jgi:anti-sigma factor RsiW
MDCRRIESLLPPYVDGNAPPTEVAEIERHLAGCPACRFAVAAQLTSRLVLQSRGRQLTPLAPLGLRTRLRATLAGSSRPSLGWRWRVAAFVSAVALFIAGVAVFELALPSSNVLYAAQLAIDHVRCFVVEMASTEKVETAELERMYLEREGWQVRVPPSDDAIGLRLVAARLCPFGVGRYAHALYRVDEREVSLYIDQSDGRSNDRLHVLGHSETIWEHAGSTYVLIARGVPEPQLQQIADYLQTQTRR